MAVPKIFGREPAFYAGLLEALLAMLLSFGMLGFIGIDDAQGVAVVMAVVQGAIGLYVAYVTKDTLLGIGVTALKAAVALLAYYHYDLNEMQLTTLVAVLTIALGSFHRTQTSPAVVPSFDVKQHSVEVPPVGEAKDTVPALNPTTGAIVEKAVPDVDRE